MPREINQLACLSTAHSSQDIAAELDLLIASPPPLVARLNPDIWQGQIVAERWLEYGWFIWVKSPGRAAMPEALRACLDLAERSEEHTSELQSIMRLAYDVFCLKKQKYNNVM